MTTRLGSGQESEQVGDQPAAAPRAQSFGPAAGPYDRLRPSYPAEALRWVLGEPPLQVLDLGAGTGTLSRVVAALGHVVVPVEPDPGMRAQLTAAGSGLTPLAGSAERIPLPDASVDAVVAGQAYHWFDPEPAHAEIARVLRPGGIFAAIWNIRDESTGWVAALSTIIDDDTAGRDGSELSRRTGARGKMRVTSCGGSFGPVEHATFRHVTTHTPETLVGLVSTRSYYLTASPKRQRQLVERVRQLCAEHPDLTGHDRFTLPYRTEVYRAIRLVCCA